MKVRLRRRTSHGGYSVHVSRLLSNVPWTRSILYGRDKVALPGSKRAPVAQLDRASDFGSEGWGFESLRARHKTIYK